MASFPGPGPSGTTKESFNFQRDKVTEVTFNALELLVVASAAHDSLDSLREPGRISLPFGSLLGSTTRASLVDRHLEEPRHATVLAGHHGRLKARGRLPLSGAGHGPPHYRLLCESIAFASRG
jgi:hypothetical protein